MVLKSVNQPGPARAMTFECKFVMNLVCAWVPRSALLHCGSTKYGRLSLGSELSWVLAQWSRFGPPQAG